MKPTVGRMVLTDSDRRRFMAKLLPLDRNGCRRWGDAPDAYGYGQFHLGSRVVKAHLVAWAIECGDFPEGLEPDHTCEVRDCTSVTHLEWVTHAENCYRIRLRSTHCRSGKHRWDEQDPIIANEHGGRECRPCRRERRVAIHQLTGKWA
jgi:hypothetical protein